MDTQSTVHHTAFILKACIKTALLLVTDILKQRAAGHARSLQPPRLPYLIPRPYTPIAITSPPLPPLIPRPYTPITMTSSTLTYTQAIHAHSNHLLHLHFPHIYLHSWMKLKSSNTSSVKSLTQHLSPLCLQFSQPLTVAHWLVPALLLTLVYPGHSGSPHHPFDHPIVL